MAKAVLKLSGKPIPTVVDRIRAIILATTGNLNYAVPVPALSFLTIQVDDLDTKYQAAQFGGKLLKAAMRASLKTMMASMNAFLGYVQSASGGDAVIINSANIEVAKSKTPVGILPPPANRRALIGIHNGEIIFRYGGVPRRIIYVIEMKLEMAPDTDYVTAIYTSKRSVVLGGLTSGQNYAIRIATVSAAGIGGWGEPLIQKAL